VKRYSDKNNREIVLGSNMSEYSVNRDLANKLMLMITFGGSFETWAGEHKINKNATPLPVVSDVYDDIQLIMNHFAIQHFPGYTTAVRIAIKKRKNAFRSALGLYLQNIESQMCMLCSSERC